MNSKPDDMKKTETLKISISKSEKENVLKLAKKKNCSVSELLVDCVHAAGERRSKTERKRVRNKVVRQNIRNVMSRNSINQGQYQKNLSELERWEEES